MERVFAHDRFIHCDGFVVHHATGDQTLHVAPYPLLQYLVAIPLQVVGVSKEWTLRVLVFVSAASLPALLAVAYRSLMRFAPSIWAPLVTVTLLASPLLWYGKSAFGEELAAIVILVAMVVVLGDARPVTIAALVALACLTKETNPPFVFALAALCVVARTHTKDPLFRPRLVAIAVGTGTGIVVNTAFNVFRFGSVRNTLYMRSGLYVPDIGVGTKSFVAQWFSPNGGLAWFWPLAPVLVFTIAGIASRGVARSRGNVWRHRSWRCCSSVRSRCSRPGGRRSGGTRGDLDLSCP